MTLTRKLSHEDINALSLRSYQGVIHFIRDSEEVDKAVEKICQDHVLGFDIESKPCFRKGEKNPPALLQLAGSDGVYIFRLIDLLLPESLCRLLADPAIVKCGVALHDDFKDLNSLREFEPAGFVDLGVAARQAGLQHHGLKGLAALLMGFRISKSAQRSNWAGDHLTEKQITYAATDAWLSRELYFEMLHRGLYDPRAVPVEEEKKRVPKRQNA
ncbi:MAG: 3'-5' exonuclease domain-containing protein 2 [Kiritimatiellae bacterium]|nr:3'-5' exonuclease domain-containing protein 2 [Kiritimatiellia bacterium]MDD4737586.1 3'-5' exonuclease domain-containing protein 2 [Kiritimatiellia bacterium]